MVKTDGEKKSGGRLRRLTFFKPSMGQNERKKSKPQSITKNGAGKKPKESRQKLNTAGENKTKDDPKNAQKKCFTKTDGGNKNKQRKSSNSPAEGKNRPKILLQKMAASVPSWPFPFKTSSNESPKNPKKGLSKEHDKSIEEKKFLNAEPAASGSDSSSSSDSGQKATAQSKNQSGKNAGQRKSGKTSGKDSEPAKHDAKNSVPAKNTAQETNDRIAIITDAIRGSSINSKNKSKTRKSDAGKRRGMSRKATNPIAQTNEPDLNLKADDDNDAKSCIRTVFEEVEAPVKPAHCREHRYCLRWKNDRENVTGTSAEFRGSSKAVHSDEMEEQEEEIPTTVILVPVPKEVKKPDEKKEQNGGQNINESDSYCPSVYLSRF